MPRFHFSLTHLENTHSLQISLHDETFELSTHTDDTLSDAQDKHPVLSRLPGEIVKSYTHFADVPDDNLDLGAPRWIQLVKPRESGSHLNEVVLMAQIIPPDILRAFYKAKRAK